MSLILFQPHCLYIFYLFFEVFLVAQYNFLENYVFVHKNCCYRCGNSNHYANNCYATYDVNGNYIDDSEDSSEEVWECSYCGKEFDSEKGALFHENRYCRKKRYY